MASIEINLRRMWNIKYEIYQRKKSQENLLELRKIAGKKMNWINIFTKKYDTVASTYFGWLSCLDMAKCMLLVYNHQNCVRKMLQLAYAELMKFPEEILVFNDNFKGITLTRNWSPEAFEGALFKKLGRKYTIGYFSFQKVVQILTLI